jgi:CRISPR/Cas system CMR-associated protein Cmr1 (group 7 of RAMP superfamily)
MDAKKIESKTQNYIKKMEEKANNSSSEKAKLIRQDMQSYSKVIYNNYINTIKPKVIDVDEDDLALAA